MDRVKQGGERPEGGAVNSAWATLQQGASGRELSGKAKQITHSNLVFLQANALQTLSK